PHTSDQALSRAERQITRLGAARGVEGSARSGGSESASVSHRSFDAHEASSRSSVTTRTRSQARMRQRALHRRKVPERAARPENATPCFANPLPKAGFGCAVGRAWNSAGNAG